MAFDLDDDELRATRILHGVDKEKTADKIFEELGYEKVSDIRENIGYVYFKKEKHPIYYEYPKIIFHNKIKKLTIQNDYLSMQELKAINKKCEELGWKE